MRTFESGATRNDDKDKLDYEGFLNPRVLREYAKYMHKHRHLEDGTLRASDNWQKGIPKDELMKSLLRHVMTLWHLHRGLHPGPDTETIMDSCCAILFNTQAYMLELLRENIGNEYVITPSDLSKMRP